MPELDLSKWSFHENAFRTGLFFGASGSGKTFFCATFPKVAWLGSAREGGFTTIAAMPKDAFCEGQAPRTYAVESPSELIADLNGKVMPLVQSGQIKTIVVELTFHADDMIRQLSQADNTWQKYADLQKHIEGLDERLKRHRGVRIIYNALAAPADDLRTPGGIMLPGKALAKKLPAMMDVTGYMRAEDVGNKTDYVLHLSAYGPYSARHRYAARLPRSIRNPTWKKFEELFRGTYVATDYNDQGELNADAKPNLAPVAALGGLRPLR